MIAGVLSTRYWNRCGGDASSDGLAGTRADCVLEKSNSSNCMTTTFQDAGPLSNRYFSRELYVNSACMDHQEGGMREINFADRCALPRCAATSRDGSRRPCTMRNCSNTALLPWPKNRRLLMCPASALVRHNSGSDTECSVLSPVRHPRSLRCDRIIRWLGQWRGTFAGTGSRRY